MPSVTHPDFNPTVAWAWEQNLTIEPKLVLVALAHRADTDNVCRASILTIAEMTMMTPAAIGHFLGGDLHQLVTRAPDGYKLHTERAIS